MKTCYCQGSDDCPKCDSYKEQAMEERIDVDAKAWEAQRRNVLICQMLSVPILGWALAATLIHGPFLIHNPERVVTKKVSAPKCDPDLVARAVFYIKELHSWNIYAHSEKDCKDPPHWLDSFQLQEVEDDNEKVLKLPLDVRLEAHRQLGY